MNTGSGVDQPGNQPIDPELLRRTMRRWSTGVTIVSSRVEEQLHGMTVSSFTSVSLDPPLVLVSLERSTRTHTLVQDSRSFAVAILAADQQDLSDRFAGRVADEADRFAGVETITAASGNPVPDGCLAYLDCRVVSAYSAASHTLFIGEVTDARILRQADPLVYFNQDYRRLTPTD